MKIENYVHLYLGCQIQSTTMGLSHGFTTYNNDKTVRHFKDGSFKFLLRPLYDMSEEEYGKLCAETGFKGIDPKDADGADDFINRSIQLNDWRHIAEASNWIRRNGFDLDGLIEAEYAIADIRNPSL